MVKRLGVVIVSGASFGIECIDGSAEFGMSTVVCEVNGTSAHFSSG